MQSIFKNELPYQSAVYVIVDRDKNQIHSTSFQINATFLIANEQLGTHNGSDATRKYLKAKCEGLGVTQNGDKMDSTWEATRYHWG